MKLRCSSVRLWFKDSGARKAMERQVFISYAADDKDWTQERVEDLATEISQAGVIVRLDVWHQRAKKRKLSLSEWQEWMAESLKSSTNIVCLVSERYRMRWERKEADAGGLGVAFEAIRLEHALYRRKQRNDGRILTLLLNGSGHDLIPEELGLDCPTYHWSAEREDLISHLKEADSSMAGPAGTSPRSDQSAAIPSDVSVLDRKLLRHQADHAIRSLQSAPAYWAGLQTSVNFGKRLPAGCLGAPAHFVESLVGLPPEALPRVMRELREVFKEKQSGFPDKESGDAALATVACFLFCTCLLIDAEAGDAVVGLPRLESQDAAHLLASMIALVMTGGRLELRPGKGVLPEGSGTYSVQLCGEDEEADFERQLYADLVHKPWSQTAALKTRPLSDSERDELLATLEDLRGDDDRARAMSFIVESNTPPQTTSFRMACAIRVPVFHAHEKVAYSLLGMSESTLVSHLKLLWADVSPFIAAANPKTPSEQLALADLMRELRALAEAMHQSSASKDIQAAADALQQAAEAKQPPTRDVLAKTKETLEGLSQIGDSGEKLVTRLLSLLNLFLM
ncbi:MAG: toll/interleukin-1 receptor domain-containing protein [Lysobacteraceae bacterium]|nr:MAG: toll/interleukin-1 receptor domain-containing protein [Xanthomonadaceae bacterium]